MSVSYEERELLELNRDDLIDLLIEGEGLLLEDERPLTPRFPTPHVPLSYAQERLWLLEQIGGLGSAYNMFASARLRGALDVSALERSFAVIVERHESLRTRFVVVDGSPVQMIDAPSPFSLKMEDFSELAPEERAAAVREQVQLLTQQPFDLERGPLFRAHLLRLSGEEHIAVVVTHHIVSDEWSIGVLIREMGALYAAFSQRRASTLPGLAVQYADYAVWQRDWLRGEVLKRQLAYWKEQLSGVPAALDLPTDRMRPAVQSFKGGVYGFRLSKELTVSLNELARSEGATLFMVLLAAFSVVLSRWSGQKDIVVGSPIAGRTHQQLEGLIGFFVNTLALRTDLGGDPSFKELLRRVKEVALGAYAHQDLPFEKLVAELQPVRDLSRQPVFQVEFVLQNVPREILQLPGLELRRSGDARQTAKLDLSLLVRARRGGLEVQFEYASDLFDRSTMERFASHFGVLLKEIVSIPDTQISELPLLSEVERRRLLEEWNDTTAAYPRDKCLHDLFTEQVERTPEAVAVVYEDQQLSYGELDRRSNQLAHHLRKLGVGPEIVVGLCVERSIELVVGLLGILKAGGAYLPLDPSYPRDRIGYMLADAKASVLVTQDSLVRQLSEGKARLLRIDTDWNEIASEQATAPPVDVGPENLVYVIYTSGSTGRPKGVAMPHRVLVNLLTWQKASIDAATERVIQLASISFDLSSLEIFDALTTGCAVLLVSDEVRLDKVRLLDLMLEQDIHKVYAPQIILELLTQEMNDRDIDGAQI